MQERQTNPARVGVAQRPDALRREVHLGDAAPRVLEHDPAVGVEPQPAVDAVEQFRACLVLEPGERPRQRRLTDAQHGSGIGDVLGLGEHDEPLQFLEVHGSTIASVRFREIAAERSRT